MYTLALLFLDNSQPDAAEDAALRNIDLLSEKGEEFLLCQAHHLLGDVYRGKGEKEKGIHHYKTGLGIASPFDWQHEVFRIHCSTAELFSDEDEFDDANTHIEQAKSHAANDARNLGLGTESQANIWYGQGRLEDARAEALCALEIYEGLGAATDVRICRELLREIERAMEGRNLDKPNSDCEFPTHDATFHRYPC